MDEHEREVGWRDPAHAARLLERPGPHAVELLTGLGPQVPHRRVVEPLGNHAVGLPPPPLDLLALKREVARIPDIARDLRGRLPRHRRELGRGGDSLRPAELRPLEELCERRAVHPPRGERRLRGLDLGRLGGEPCDSLGLREPEPSRHGREPAVGVVVPQGEPVLGAAGEHAIGLVDALRDEVVDQHADVRRVALDHERLAARGGERRIRPGHDPLRRCLLVARRAVDLPGAKKPAHSLAFERHGELVGRAVVVFDGIAIAHHLGPLEPRHHPDHGILHVARQARGDPVHIDLLRAPPLRLEKQLVALFVGKPHDLVFDARAIPRPARLDLAGVHRRPVQVRPDEVVDLRRRPRDPADHLLLLDAVGQKRKWLRINVARLDVEPRKIDRPREQPAGRAGLEPIDPDPDALEGPAHTDRGSLPRPATGRLRLAGVHDGLQEGAGREHDGRRPILGITPHPHARDPPLGPPVA